MKLINLKKNETALREAMEFIDWMNMHKAEYLHVITLDIGYDAGLEFIDRMREAGATREKLQKELVGC